MSNPNPPASGSAPAAGAEGISRASAMTFKPAPRWFLIVGLLALAGYGIFLGVNTTVVAGGSDSSGYLNSARLIASGELQTELRVPPEIAALEGLNRKHFSPQGFNLFPPHPRLAPTYPTGLPLHFAFAAALLGWEAGPFLVQLLAALAAVWLCYLAARELGIHHLLAAAGAAILAGFPVFIFTSIQTLSDTMATTWALAAIWGALRSARGKREGGGGAGFALATGAAFAMAVLVRPTNVLLAPGVLVLLGFDLRRVALFVVGGLPGAVWFALYNQKLYGGPLRSGYGTIHEAFAWHYGAPTAVHFAKWLALLLPVVVLALPFFALRDSAARRREWIGLMLVFAAVVGLYLFYDVSHDVWWCLRFILPAVPALILAALMGIDALARGPAARWPGAFRPVAALVLALWAAGNSWHWTRGLHVLYVPGYERAYADAAKVVRERIPEGALVVCSAVSGTLYFYTDLPILLFDTISAEDFARYRLATRQAGRPIYAVLFNIEEDLVLRERCPGNWTKVTAVENIGLWRLDG